MSTIHKAICIFKNLTVKACRHLYSYENKHMSGSKSNDNPHVKQPLNVLNFRYTEPDFFWKFFPQFKKKKKEEKKSRLAI